MKRGEVWWAHLGGKRRPVVVLTRDAAIRVLSRVVVAPATRTIRGIPSEAALGKPDGMPVECALSFDNLRAIPKRALRGRITTLSPARLDEVCEALRYTLDC